LRHLFPNAIFPTQNWTQDTLGYPALIGKNKTTLPVPEQKPGTGKWGTAHHLMRMSFLTEVTPPTFLATSTALFAMAAELTKPLS